VRTARYRADRCRAACATGHLDATDLADLLVARGVPFRDAHHKVGAAVAAAEELGCVLADLPGEVRDEHLPELDGVALAEELSVEAILERRSALGGTAPSRVRAEVKRWKSRLQSWNA
jgi:argininosuccinate lyase